MADDGDLVKTFRFHQAGQIVDVVGKAVAGAERPAGIAVAAQIGRHDVKIRSQRPRQMIPAAGVIEAAMHQQQWRRRCVTPIREMKLEPLRLKIARLRRVRCNVHRDYLKAGAA